MGTSINYKHSEKELEMFEISYVQPGCKIPYVDRYINISGSILHGYTLILKSFGINGLSTFTT